MAPIPRWTVWQPETIFARVVLRSVNLARGSVAAAVLAGCVLAHVAAMGAPRFVSTTWRTEDGLPHSSVNAIVQTHGAYLWLGTFVGLVRFDSVKFSHFSAAILPQLGPGRVSRLFQARDGTLWIGLETGRLLAFKDGETRIHLPNSASGADAIVALAQDKGGAIWLQTASGQLGRLTADSVEIMAQSGATPLRSGLGLIVDELGTLWIGTKDGLRIWSDGHLQIPAGAESLPSHPIDAMAPARAGGIWIFGDGQLRQLQSGKLSSPLVLPDAFQGPAGELLESSDGSLWLAGANSGVFCRGPDGSWENVGGEFGLRGGTKALCEDIEGNIWRGGFGGGLTRLRPAVFSAYPLPEGESDRYALGLSASHDSPLWSVVNRQTLGRLDAGLTNATNWELFQKPGALEGARTIFVDTSRTVWLGWDDGRIGQWQGRPIVLLHASPDPDYLNAFFEDSHSNLWVGFSRGAGVGTMPECDPAKWHVVPGLAYPDVHAIAETPDGAMWFGTHYGGVFRLQNGKWTRFTTHDGLPSDYVRCFATEPDGTLWLGTMYGLCRWRNGVFKQVKASDGLWNESLSGIAQDPRGNFWMSSFGGIFRVSKKELNDFADGLRSAIECIGYNRDDGLLAQECPGGFQPSWAETKDGRLWFPTVEGVVSVAPERLATNRVPPRLSVEVVPLEGSHLATRRDGTRELAAGGHGVSFQLIALSFTAPSKVRFRHKLEGLDTAWSRADSARDITYDYLPPVHYTFRFTACNNDGVWNPDGAALALWVQPFLWQRWWFRAGLGLLLGVAVAGGVRHRERRKALLRLEQLERQHALERERSRIAKDIHDEVGASLTQIAFLSERVQSARAEPAEVERWSQRVSVAARQTIASLDEIVWAVSPKHDTLESLANYLAQFAQEYLALAGVRCVLEVLTVVPPLEVSADLRHNLLLAAREALQNAVAHSGATEVRVGLVLTETALEISVRDNGRGFAPESARPDGNGLVNMRQRLQQIGGRLTLESRPGQGTCVTLSVPRSRLQSNPASSQKQSP